MRERVGGYYIEFVRIGAYAKCTALDPDTGAEATVVGPARNADEQLKRNAVRKLQMLLSRS